MRLMCYVLVCRCAELLLLWALVQASSVGRRCAVTMSDCNALLLHLAVPCSTSSAGTVTNSCDDMLGI